MIKSTTVFYFFYTTAVILFCVVSFTPSLVSSAAIDFYYPQWQSLTKPTDVLPDGRHGATCTKATIDLSTLASSIYDPESPTFADTFPEPAPPTNSQVDSLVCFGGLSRQKVDDGYYLPESDGLVVGDNVYHTFTMNDINLFDIARERWYAINLDNASQRKYDEPPFVRGHPDGRAFATSAFYDGNLFVWGGSSPLQLLSNSLLVYSFANDTWREITYSAGQAPRVRTHFSGVQFGQYLYVFGGSWYIPDFAETLAHPKEPALPPYYNDLWRLNLETYRWTKLNPGNVPTARGSHTAVVTSAGKMYVWGGDGYGPCFGDETRTCLGGTTFEDEVWSIDLTLDSSPSSVFRWSKADFNTRRRASSVYPPYRDYQAMALSANEEFFIVTGGTFANRFFSDIYKYNLTSETWQAVPVSYPSVDNRYGQVIVALKNGTTANSQSANPQVAEDLFLMLMGRRFDYADVATYGVLFTGGYISVRAPGDVVEGSTDTIIISFDRHSPSQKLTPKDNCGNRLDSSAVNLAFQAMTERSQPDNSLIQRVDFEDSIYEVNATALVSFDPTIGFSLNNSVGLSVDFDFTLFGSETLVNYGNTSFTVPPSTNKWSFNVGGWRFLDVHNTLEIEVGLSLQNDRTFDRVFRTNFPSQKRVRYTFISSASHVTIEVYISTFALRTDPDDASVMEVVDVGHRVNFEPGTPNPVVVFVLPHFEGELYYDPDFGVTLDTDTASACQASDEFEGWKIAIIVLSGTVPCIICCVIALGVVIYMLVVRHRRQRVNDLDMIDFDLEDSASSRTSSKRYPAGAIDIDL